MSEPPVIVDPSELDNNIHDDVLCIGCNVSNAEVSELNVEVNDEELMLVSPIMLRLMMKKPMLVNPILRLMMKELM